MSPSNHAEARFREAFNRLKAGTPQVLKEGARPTQNNVAREAGKHPSALRKERCPELVAEIQSFEEANSSAGSEAVDQTGETERLKETIELLKVKQQLEASRVLSLLLEVNQLRKALSEAQAAVSATKDRS